jgi:hypothetical protein
MQVQNAPKRNRSDKAETYRDRFDMVVKIEECLFVSRCHQGRGRNVSGAIRYLFQSLPIGMSGDAKGAQVRDWECSASVSATPPPFTHRNSLGIWLQSE